MNHDHAMWDDLHDQDRENELPIGQPDTIEEIEGLEMFRLLSVGIDIGSSTSHLVFSQLTLRRQGTSYSSQFRVTDREVLYRSPIMLTPYLSGTLIDTQKVQEFVQGAYREAGFTSGEVDTGAVVITGEALKKENARPISELFAKESGRFICASAGPNHEALLAAYGSGAVAISRGEDATVLNVDMGGGTTKLSLIRGGDVVATAAIAVGARLIAFDDMNVVTRLEEPAKLLLDELGSDLTIGQRIDQAAKDAFAALMAKCLSQVVDGGGCSGLAAKLLVTDPLPAYAGPDEVDFVVFSGGVSEYIYGHDETPYGDLGPQLCSHVLSELRQVFPENTLRQAAEGIRATVIGAGEYTMQASGTTSHLSGADALPAFGLKVIRPMPEEGEPLAGALERAMAKFDLCGFTPGLALALSPDGEMNYRTLRAMAEGIASVVDKENSATAPLFIVLDKDVAKSLGGILKEELLLHDRDVVVVDGINVGDLDYLDIGVPMGISEVVPVTVKSLVFPNSG